MLWAPQMIEHGQERGLGVPAEVTAREAGGAPTGGGVPEAGLPEGVLGKCYRLLGPGMRVVGPADLGLIGRLALVFVRCPPVATPMRAERILSTSFACLSCCFTNAYKKHCAESHTGAIVTVEPHAGHEIYPCPAVYSASRPPERQQQCQGTFCA